MSLYQQFPDLSYFRPRMVYRVVLVDPIPIHHLTAYSVRATSRRGHMKKKSHRLNFHSVERLLFARVCTKSSSKSSTYRSLVLDKGLSNRTPLGSILSFKLSTYSYFFLFKHIKFGPWWWYEFYIVMVNQVFAISIENTFYLNFSFLFDLFSSSHYIRYFPLQNKSYWPSAKLQSLSMSCHPLVPMPRKLDPQKIFP